MATISKDTAENLSTLALLISNDVRSAMMASFVTHVADAWFHEHGLQGFRTNPANTLVYAALGALEEHSIVRVSEHLKDEHKLHPISADVEIRRKKDLSLHRHAISHPATVEWTNPKMQEFSEADRDGYDWRPAQLWDLQRSINEELRKVGKEARNESIAVTLDMAASLHLILDLTRREEYAVPTVNQLLTFLQAEVAKYQALLEQHPDGARDPEGEKARAERRRLRRERWAAEAAKKKTG